MKTLKVIYFFLIISSLCSQKNILQGQSNTIDTSDFVIIKLNSEKHNNNRVNELTTNQIDSILVILNKAIENYNDKIVSNYLAKGKKYCKDSISGILDIKNYKFQIKPITNSDDQKFWIHGFCKGFYNESEYTRINWRNKMMMVADGGDCFIDCSINLTKKIFENFQINFN